MEVIILRWRRGLASSGPFAVFLENVVYMGTTVVPIGFKQREVCPHDRNAVVKVCGIIILHGLVGSGHGYVMQRLSLADVDSQEFHGMED